MPLNLLLGCRGVSTDGTLPGLHPDVLHEVKSQTCGPGRSEFALVTLEDLLPCVSESMGLYICHACGSVVTVRAFIGLSFVCPYMASKHAGIIGAITTHVTDQMFPVIMDSVLVVV